MVEPLKLIFKPGINRDTTDYGNTGGWYDINLARWVSGTPASLPIPNIPDSTPPPPPSQPGDDRWLAP